VETNGRIPGRHSLLQIGAVCFDLKGRELSHFVMNLKPLPSAGEDPVTMKWWSGQPREIWHKVTKNPVDPQIVIRKFFDWMAQFKEPVLLAAPVAFDFFWLRYYLELYIGPSGWPLFHNCLDARSIVFALTGQYEGDWKEWIRAVTQREIPSNPSPHYALSDARSQGLHLFCLFQWTSFELSLGK